MSDKDITFSVGGKQRTLDRKRIAELAASLNLAEAEDAAKQIATAFGDSDLVQWGPAVEAEPQGPGTQSPE